MDMKKCVVGSVSGGVVLFVLGWLIYGYVFADTPGMAEEMVMWAVIVGSLLSGMLLTMVLDWNGAGSAGDAAKAGATFGLVLGLAMGFMSHGTMDMSMAPGLGMVIRDAVVAAVMYGVAGAVIAMAAGRGAAADG